MRPCRDRDRGMFSLLAGCTTNKCHRGADNPARGEKEARTRPDVRSQLPARLALGRDIVAANLLQLLNPCSFRPPITGDRDARATSYSGSPPHHRSVATALAKLASFRVSLS